MWFISTKVHGVLDYLMALNLLGFAEVGGAMVGAALFLESLMTEQQPGGMPVREM